MILLLPAQASLAEEHQVQVSREIHLESYCVVPEPSAATGLAAPPAEEQGSPHDDTRLLSPSKGGLCADALQRRAAMLEGSGAAGVISSQQLNVPSPADTAAPVCGVLPSSPPQKAGRSSPDPSIAVAQSADLEHTPSKEDWLSLLEEIKQMVDITRYLRTITPPPNALEPCLQRLLKNLKSISQGMEERALDADQATRRPALAAVVANSAANPNQPDMKRQLHTSEHGRGSKRACQRAETVEVLNPAAAHH